MLRLPKGIRVSGRRTARSNLPGWLRRWQWPWRWWHVGGLDASLRTGARTHNAQSLRLLSARHPQAPPAPTVRINHYECSRSVGRRGLYRFDDENVRRSPGSFQPEPQLFYKRSKQPRLLRIDGSGVTLPLKIDIELAA